jgi:hypothetical protein
MRILALVLFLLPCFTFAQQEGISTVQGRFEKPHFSFVNVGPVISASGDYKNGLQLNFGYGKRLNRMLTISGVIGYQRLATDYSADVDFFVSETDDPEHFGPAASADGDPYDDYWEVLMEGGDLSVLSIGGMLRLNLTPHVSGSSFLIYAFAQPTLSSVTHAEVTRINRLTDAFDYVETNTIDGDNNEAMKKSSTFAAAISIGPGVELFPGKKISFTAQLSLNNIFSFGKELGSDKEDFPHKYSSIVDEQFPFTTKSLTSITVNVGIHYNF